MQLTARQATLLHGWMNARPFLTWADVRAKGLLLPRLAELGLRARDLAAMQPDPKEWAAHAGAEPCHARFMLAWPANPLVPIWRLLSRWPVARLDRSHLRRRYLRGVCAQLWPCCTAAFCKQANPNAT